MEEIVDQILNSMSNCKKTQRIFIAGLLSVLMTFQGKATFRNLSRYSGMHEKFFSRWSRYPFDFTKFNRYLIAQNFPDKTEKIAAIDASFMAKSGRKTDELGYFYNGKAQRAKKGLEMSLISVVDLKACMTAQKTLDCESKSRVDLYAEYVEQALP